MRKEPITIPQLAKALEKKFGPGYIPHKLSEECLELSVAIHKIQALAKGYSKCPMEERLELGNNLIEELSHVNIFFDLFMVDFNPKALEEFKFHYEERQQRLTLKV